MRARGREGVSVWVMGRTQTWDDRAMVTHPGRLVFDNLTGVELWQEHDRANEEAAGA